MLQVPKISCIAIANNSCENIIDNFNIQSYPNKELVIVSSGNNNQLNDEIKGNIKDVKNIQFVTVRFKDLKFIQDLAVEITTGEFICQWESLSKSHPHRLASQYQKMNEHVIACVYNRYLKYVNNSIYLVEHDLFETIMFRKSIFDGFLYSTNIIDNLKKSGDIVGLNLGYQYINFNTSLNHLIFEKQELLKQENLIREMLILSKLKGPISIRSIKDIAFIYEDKYEPSSTNNGSTCI